MVTEAHLFMIFPTVGRDWELSEQQMQDWQQAYPDLDVPRELQRARIWLDVNVTRRKTQKGMPRFLVSWLNRSRNGKQYVPTSAASRPPLAPTFGPSFVCPHDPPCYDGRWKCHQRTELARIKAAMRREA
jgi:hypothetical protein